VPKKEFIETSKGGGLPLLADLVSGGSGCEGPGDEHEAIQSQLHQRFRSRRLNPVARPERSKKDEH